MAISNDLFLAILAMDAYNRGYNPGINIAGTRIGNAAVGVNSSILDTAGSVGVDQSASFFAQAYDWNGQTVISYRGTDVRPRILGGDDPTFSLASWRDVTQWAQFVGAAKAPEKRVKP